jgi:hypothetical protein
MALVRWSSNEQDTRDTTRDAAVQVRPRRSVAGAISPKHLHVRLISYREAREPIEHYHYLHSMPSGVLACFGVYADGALVGAVVFANGNLNSHKLVSGSRPSDCATLARLWLDDCLGPNSESRVLGVVLRHIRRTTNLKFLLSYADPVAGHVGTIYQATNWLYLGATGASGYLDVGMGALRHPRTVSEVFGSNSVRHLRATGVPARRVYLPGKHRYVYFIDASWRWRLRLKAWRYPCRPP